MKKVVMAAMGLLMTATAAQAEHKLLVTDVLEPKQVEMQALYEYSSIEGNLHDPVEGNGKIKSHASEANLSVGIGLLHGLEVTASVPYLFNERTSASFASGAADTEKRDGIGDFALEGKYRLLGGEEAPVTVVTGLGLKFDTAGTRNGGTGSTDVSPFIAASMNLPRHHTPYAIYRANLRSGEANPDTHTLSLGLEKEVNHTFTLDAKIDANFNTATSHVSSNQDFVFELSSYIQVAHNFYVLPNVAYLTATDQTLKVTDTRVTGQDGYRVGASLYYLF
ncbi:hypothetical protein GMST_01990 [Geomonas silvestris]|uniref:Transporter n=1 Tax=Geomonas silvestris TaxID=2740184 RepID=A0A6V8MD94_9BACT|nr:hypothetical protein [Geomonas silvestris]GFO57874.1 hypothetical protein GMST_01990 [Geomonas silvestris]